MKQKNDQSTAPTAVEIFLISLLASTIAILTLFCVLTARDWMDGMTASGNSEYSIETFEGMPCIRIQSDDTITGSGWSCDWSKWEGNQ